FGLVLQAHCLFGFFHRVEQDCIGTVGNHRAIYSSAGRFGLEDCGKLRAVNTFGADTIDDHPVGLVWLKAVLFQHGDIRGFAPEPSLQPIWSIRALLLLPYCWCVVVNHLMIDHSPPWLPNIRSVSTKDHSNGRMHKRG